MKGCLQACVKHAVSCPVQECRYWVDYKNDLNCSLESIRKNDSMTLREVADRLKISYVRVKQIQDKAISKIIDLL
mgnify:FL=1